MIRLRYAVLAGSALALVTTAAGAQSRRNDVPSGMLPGSGQCRVWINGVPPGRQPAATDCATARRNAPANSRILYGASSNGRTGIDREREQVRLQNDARLRDEARLRYDARQRQEAQLREQARIREQARVRNNDGRAFNDAQRRERDLQKADLQRQREVDKAESKRIKELNKERKHDGDDHRNDDRGHDHR